MDRPEGRGIELGVSISRGRGHLGGPQRLGHPTRLARVS